MKGYEIIEILDPCLRRHVFGDEYRRKVITRIIGELLVESHTEEEALSMLFGYSSYLEPPLNNEELLYCQALLRMLYTFDDIKVDSIQEVFEILEIPQEKMFLPEKELDKVVKKAYWGRFNLLFNGLKSIFANAREMTIITKAYKFVRR